MHAHGTGGHPDGCLAGLVVIRRFAWYFAPAIPVCAAEAQKMKGISILVDRLYSGYESGKRRAMMRSSTMAL